MAQVTLVSFLLLVTYCSTFCFHVLLGFACLCLVTVISNIQKPLICVRYSFNLTSWTLVTSKIQCTFFSFQIFQRSWTTRRFARLWLLVRLVEPWLYVCWNGEILFSLLIFFFSCVFSKWSSYSDGTSEFWPFRAGLCGRVWTHQFICLLFVKPRYRSGFVRAINLTCFCV